MNIKQLININYTFVCIGVLCFKLCVFAHGYSHMVDCSWLFADRLRLFSKFICDIIGYFLLVIGRPTVCGTNFTS